MHNSKFIKIMALIWLITLLPNSLLAWDGTTHIAITQKALNSLPSSVSTDSELRNIVLATSMGPDFSGLSESYGVWHDPDFVEALQKVAGKLEGREKDRMLAVSYGWLAHITADKVVHSSAGYVNAKNLFNKLPDEKYLPSHIATEYSVSLLNYKENQVLIDGVSFYMPPTEHFLAAIGEYKAIKIAKGEPEKTEFDYSGKQYESDVLKFKASSEAIKASFRNVIKTRPDLISQMDKKFSDRETGVNGTNGISQSTEAVKTGFETLNKYSPAPGKPTLGDKINYVAGNSKEKVTEAAISGLANQAIKATTGTSTGREAVNKIIAGQSAEDAVYIKYVTGLALEKELSLEEIIELAQADVSSAGSTEQRLTEACNQVTIAQKRVDGLEAKVNNRSFVSKILGFFFGCDDKSRLAEAKKELTEKTLVATELSKKLENEKSVTASGTSPISQVDQNRSEDY